MSTYNQKVAGFLKTHKGQNKRAVEMVLLGIEHMLENGREWTGLARLLSGVEPRMATMYRRIIDTALGGVSVRRDIKQPSGLRFVFGDNFGPSEKIAGLRKLVEQGASIYGQDMQAYVGMEPKPAAAFDAEKRFAALAKAAVAADMSLEAALNQMRVAFNQAQINQADAIESTPVAEVAEL